MTAHPPDHPAEGESGPPDLSAVDFVVPDDLSELDDEVAAYQFERLRTRRRARLRRVGAAFGWHPQGVSTGGVTGLVVVASLIVASAIGLAPGQPRLTRPAAAALAAPKVAPGVPGGLLPDRDVLVAGKLSALRSLRPAVLLLVPAGCLCAAAVHAVVGSAATSRINVFLVTSAVPGSVTAAQTDQLAADRSAGATYAVVAYDTGALDSVYRAHGVLGPLAVFVRADGVVTGNALPVTADTHIESRLDPLIAGPVSASASPGTSAT